jgi:hypothetical protein
MRWFQRFSNLNKVMAMRFVDQHERFIDYRLNLLGIRVWPQCCQLVSRNGNEWIALGPRLDLPIDVPRRREELKDAAGDTLRMTAYQYDAERPGSDLLEVLRRAKSFNAALREMPGVQTVKHLMAPVQP